LKQKWLKTNNLFIILKKFALPIFLVIVILTIDQVLKVWIKTHMYLGQEFFIAGDWFRIHFTENEGMAFGMELGGSYGKLLLSLFRIGAVSFIGYYLYNIITSNQSFGLAISISLILAGALGNIVDSVFYGVLFSDSAMDVAHFMPVEGGYATWFHGRVVDMFYFPLVSGFFPEWLPFWGGEYFQFFRPVFNVADASITIGVFLILIFQKRFFKEEEIPATTNDTPHQDTVSAS
jgi:signal peptidase II